MAIATKQRVTRNEDLDMEIEQACHSILEGRGDLSRLSDLQEMEAMELELKLARMDLEDVKSSMKEAFDIFSRFYKKV